MIRLQLPPFLAEAPLLLVLDNCEHLMDAFARVAQALSEPLVLSEDLGREHNRHGAVPPCLKDLPKHPPKKTRDQDVRIQNDLHVPFRTSRTATSTSSGVIPARRALSSARDTSPLKFTVTHGPGERAPPQASRRSPSASVGAHSRGYPFASQMGTIPASSRAR